MNYSTRQHREAQKTTTSSQSCYVPQKQNASNLPSIPPIHQFPCTKKDKTHMYATLSSHVHTVRTMVVVLLSTKAAWSMPRLDMPPPLISRRAHLDQADVRPLVRAVDGNFCHSLDPRLLQTAPPNNSTRCPPEKYHDERRTQKGGGAGGGCVPNGVSRRIP